MGCGSAAPETGNLQAREITDTRNHSGVKHLITLTVDPDGKDSDAKPDTITAPDEHPFWLPDFGKWVTAEELEPGMDEIPDPQIGHMIGYVMGGSGRDPQNLVPLHTKTNSPDMYNKAERPIRNAMLAKKWTAVRVTPIYGNPNSGVPTSLDYTYTIFGSKPVHCTIINQPTKGGTTCT
jgi:hypothetical protein